MSFTIVLPIKVNANARGHSRYQPKVKAHRQAATLAFRPRWRVYGFDQQGQQQLLDGGLVITLTRIAPRELDGHDNLRTAMKHVVDGITDALGLKSDRDPRLTWAYEQERGRPRQYAVEVLLEERSA